MQLLQDYYDKNDIPYGKSTLLKDFNFYTLTFTTLLLNSIILT